MENNIELDSNNFFKVNINSYEEYCRLVDYNYNNTILENASVEVISNKKKYEEEGKIETKIMEFYNPDIPSEIKARIKVDETIKNIEG